MATQLLESVARDEVTTGIPQIETDMKQGLRSFVDRHTDYTMEWLLLLKPEILTNNAAIRTQQIDVREDPLTFRQFASTQEEAAGLLAPESSFSAAMQMIATDSTIPVKLIVTNGADLNIRRDLLPISPMPIQEV
jgi:hypothetical protein